LVRPRYEPIGTLVVEWAGQLTTLRDSRVVELSAGTGTLTHQLAPLAASAFATDVSEPMMTIGRACPAPACRRVQWQRADVEDTGLADCSADILVSCLGPFRDTDRAVAETGG
jgi:ubiquinone/menaquinone biosynthesis C-methylase UbiE